MVGDSPGLIRRTEKFGLEHVKGRTVGQTIFIELRAKYSMRACRPIHSRFFGRPLFYGIERSRIYPSPSLFLSSIFLIPAVDLRPCGRPQNCPTRSLARRTVHPMSDARPHVNSIRLRTACSAKWLTTKTYKSKIVAKIPNFPVRSMLQSGQPPVRLNRQPEWRFSAHKPIVALLYAHHVH